jgi:hypothetical protein
MLLAAMTVVSALASGVYNFPSHVYIVGPAAFAPGVTSQTYTISATTTIGSIGFAGDPEFSFAVPHYAGTKSAIATLSFNPVVGGDYVATITATSTSARRTNPNHASVTIKAHVPGANYSLGLESTGIVLTSSEVVGTAYFILTSTGETPLIVSKLTAFTSNPANGVVFTPQLTKPIVLVSGATLRIPVTYTTTVVENDLGYYSTSVDLTVTANSKNQPPASMPVFVTLPP